MTDGRTNPDAGIDHGIDHGEADASRFKEAAGPAPSPGEDSAVCAVSVIVLVSERPGDLEGIYRQYARALSDNQLSYEFVFAFDPAHAASADPVRELAEAGEPLQLVVASRSGGEAELLKLANSLSQGNIILTLPGYHRIEASYVGKVVRSMDEETDLAVVRRHPRSDSWMNQLQTRLFHSLLKATTHVDLDDVGCGVRAIRREVLEEMPPYGDFNRFLPVLASWEGYRVRQVDAPQHNDDRHTRVYNPGTYLRRLIDLVAVFFLTRFTYKPLRFFGLVGTTLSAVGGAILLVLLVQRMGGQGIADRPMLLLGVLLATLGVQAFALGLIGEIIVHFNVPSRSRYRLVDDPPDLNDAD